MRVANPLGLLAGDEVSGDLIGAELDDGIEQGDVDVLTTTRAVASLDGRENANGGVQPGEHVGNRDHHLYRAAAGAAVFHISMAVDRHQAPLGLAEQIVAGTLCVRAVLTVGGDRAVDQLRIHPGQRLIVEPVALQVAELVVLHQDVALRGQLAQQRLTLRLRDVHRDRALVAIAAGEIGRVRGRFALAISQPRGAPRAGIVTSVRSLHLDHVSAEVTERLRAPRASQNAGEIEDAKMGKRARHN